MLFPAPRCLRPILILTSAFALLSLTVRCAAETDSAAVTTEHQNDTAPPPVLGFNFSLNYTGQHNSDTGWAQIAAPDLSYRLNRHLSFDSSIGYFPSLNAYVTTNTNGVKAQALRTGHNLLGDLETSGHYSLGAEKLDEEVAATVGLPTGNVRYGIGAGTVTYNVTNHVDYPLGWFDPDAEVGIGNSSELSNRVVSRTYTAVGLQANFQAGGSIDLPWRLNLDIEGYEQLPIDLQNVFGTITKKKTKQTLAGAGTAEDNGISSELEFDLSDHLKLAASYTRSFIQGLDTAALGLTWTLRAPRSGSVR